MKSLFLIIYSFVFIISASCVDAQKQEAPEDLALYEEIKTASKQQLVSFAHGLQLLRLVNRSLAAANPEWAEASGLAQGLGDYKDVFDRFGDSEVYLNKDKQYSESIKTYSDTFEGELRIVIKGRVLPMEKDHQVFPQELLVLQKLAGEETALLNVKISTITGRYELDLNKLMQFMEKHFSKSKPFLNGQAELELDADGVSLHIPNLTLQGNGWQVILSDIAVSSLDGNADINSIKGHVAISEEDNLVIDANFREFVEEWQKELKNCIDASGSCALSL